MSVPETPRKAIPKRLRFEVMRRDNHTCRYCGQTPPDVKLTIDHVIPVSLGGQDVPENLVTACQDCNAGKSSASPDAETVADVAQDALRWRAAMEVAQEMAEREQDVKDAFRQEFYDMWRGWTYEGPMKVIDGKLQATRVHIDLPGDWSNGVGELHAAGLTVRDMRDAIEIAMTAKCKDEYRYFFAVARNKIGVRQQVAQELIRRGVV